MPLLVHPAIVIRTRQAKEAMVSNHGVKMHMARTALPMFAVLVDMLIEEKDS